MEEGLDKAVRIVDTLCGDLARELGDLAVGVVYPDERLDNLPRGEEGMEGISPSAARVARIEAEPRGGEADEALDIESLLDSISSIFFLIQQRNVPH